MNYSSKAELEVTVNSGSKNGRHRFFSDEERHRILDEADRCARADEVAALVHRHGLFSSQLNEWQDQRHSATDPARRGPPQRSQPLEQFALATLMSVLLWSLVCWSRSNAATFVLSQWLLLLIEVPIAAIVSVAGWLVTSSETVQWRWLARHLEQLSRYQLSATVFVTSASPLLYLAQILLIDEPTDRLTLVSSAAAIAMAGLLAVASRRVFPPLPQDEAMRRKAGRAYAILLCTTTGLILEMTDLLSFPRSYSGYHLATTAASLTCFTLGACTLVRCCGRSVRNWLWLCLLSSCVGSLAIWWSSRATAFADVARIASPTSRVLYALRSLTDRDGDSHSAYLGGGDCDDADPATYPLSVRGRDCLDWTRHESAPDVQHRPGRSDTPSVVLLLTVDAFRCGFGVKGSRYRDVCPTLTRMSIQGRVRHDSHTHYPNTASSISSLHSGELNWRSSPFPSGRILGEELRRAGFRTAAVITHRNLLSNKAVAPSFDTLDDALLPMSKDPIATSSEMVTDHVLALISQQQTDSRPLFVWAHYLDTHSPYVEHVGSHWSVVDADGYAAEVRRVDNAIARITKSLERNSRSAFIFVTADHGEEMGEHGYDHHGYSLYDGATQVPMLAWSNGGDARRFGGDLLPASMSEVSDYLLHVALGRPFSSSNGALLMTTTSFGDQIGWVSDGWKLIVHSPLHVWELYNLQEDPDEEHDLARVRPDVVNRLGGQLMQALKRVR